MKHFILTLLLCVSCGVLLQSQHCGWDNAYVIIVEVTDESTGEDIRGLDIVLADSTGQPYTSHWNLSNHKDIHLYQKTEVLKFGQNLKRKRQKFSRYLGPFPFGVNNYMLLVYANNYRGFNKSGKDLIVIKDSREKYEDVAIKFDPQKITPMCTGNAIWRNEDALENAQIRVALRKRK